MTLSSHQVLFPSSRRRGGFALLVTIVLVAFLVLLLVGLATFARVETQVADNAQQLARARQNALFALNLSVAHLQQAAGPDLRLTSRADLEASGQNAHFTGVWQPGDAEPFTWLVSGNQSVADPLAVTPSSAPSPTGGAAAEVFLVGDASVSNAADRVKLKLQPIEVEERQIPGLDPGSSTPAAIGHYAYWVGDEGVKASVALHDQTDELDYDNVAPASLPSNSPTTGVDWSADTELRAQLRQLAPAHPHVPELFPSFATTPAINTALRNVLSYEQLAFLDPANLDADDLRDRFHDATTISRAVLVDHTRGTNGGLRQDLSDSPDVFPSAIRNFVKERPASRTGLQAVHSQKQAESGTDTEFPMFSKGPVLTEFLIRFQFWRHPTSGNLRLKYEVQAELWNPYACTLDASNNLRIRLSNLPVVTVTTTVDGATHTVDLNKNVTLNGVVDTALTWAPGQIRWVKGAGGSGNYSETGAARSIDALVEPTQTIVSFTDDPTLDTDGAIEIAFPAIDSSTAPITVELWRGGTLSQAIYRPAIDFDAGNAANNTANLNDAGWHFGYAFDFRDDIRDWIHPTRATAQDPRRTNLDGDFFEPSFPYWSTQPADNIGEISRSGTDTFNESRTIVLFDLPRQEPVSVGSLQHVIGEKPYRVGNPTDTSLGLASVNDYFDRYYFSTLPRWFADGDWDPLSPPRLPNRYIEVHVPDPAAPPALGDRFGSNSTTADYLLDRTHAAKYLLLRGAFNINSTSEAAWRAVLAGIQIPAWSHGGATPTDVALKNAFFRLSHGAQELDVDPNTPPDAANAFVRGALVVTDDQIEDMATEIVRLLKVRGRPYATLQEFIDDGVIEKAITAAGINSADPADVPPYSPGWLSQADVLTAIAPFITPRSDTFRVRAYGDVRNPVTEEIEGRAWCEAIVQRLPELTEPATGVLAPATDPLEPSATKYPFGRRFKIVSFRWLSPDDI